MKKLLALVLALVMTLSLCVVSSNAKFDDAADFTYGEAIDVMSAVGVFVGDGSGKFDAKANLTRAQAAKVIAYLDLGESVAEALPAVQMFSDVPATHWAAKYIAYCADAEIVAGVGNGKFDPEAQVTGYQFAKMLLVVLNYDAAIEKLTGSTWSISCAKLVKENKLAKGFKGSLNDGLTREAAAQLAFRAIQAYPVNSYTGYGLLVDKDSGLITAGASGKAVKNGTKDKVDNFYLDLYSKKLSTADADDKLGNPAHNWIYKNAKIGTYADEPVLTYTTEWTWAQAKEDLAELGVTIDTVTNNVHIVVDMYHNGYIGAANVVNGVEVTNATKDRLDETTMKELIADNTKLGGNGIVTKFYADGDDYLDRVTEATYVLAEVTSVGKDLASTKLVNEAALTFEGGLVASDKLDTLGFGDVYADAAKGDLFLVAPKGGETPQSVTTDIVSIIAPVVKEGKLTNNGAKSCKLDGELYTKAKATDANDFNIDATNNVKLYCDEYGYAYGTGETVTSSKLVVVTDRYLSLVKGKMVEMVDVVFADGTTGSLNLGVPTSATETFDYPLYIYSEKNDGSGEYEIDKCDPAGSSNLVKSNGYEYELTATLKAGSAKLTNNLYFADDVKTIFCYEGNNGKIKTVVADGVKEVKASTTEKVHVFFTVDSNDEDQEINAFFVWQKPANTITGTDGLVLIVDRGSTFPVFDKDGNKVWVYSYTAYVNGKLVEDFYVAGGADVAGFYELEDDVDIENGYLLNNEYDDKGGTSDAEDIQVAIETIDLDDLKKTDIIEIDGRSVRIDSEKTKFVDICDDDNYIIENLNGLLDALRTEDAKTIHGDDKAELFVIYDDDTTYASYVYVGFVGYHN